MTAHYPQSTPGSRYQAGVMTTFTGVLILVLLTLMMFFAMRVGVFEQRVSSSEMRQKLAFHAAESGVHHAKEFFRANSAYVASATSNLIPDTSVDKVAGE
jgi:Tfp pilus assembly protein PilX